MNSFGYTSVEKEEKKKEEAKQYDYSLLIAFASLILSVIMPAFGVALGYIGIKSADKASNDESMALSIIGFACGIVLLIVSVFTYF